MGGRGEGGAVALGSASSTVRGHKCQGAKEILRARVGAKSKGVSYGYASPTP